MVTIKWITRVNVRVSGDREAEQRPEIMGYSILSGRGICAVGSGLRDGSDGRGVDTSDQLETITDASLMADGGGKEGR